MLILASNSPRRKQLLSLGGWDFMVLSPDVDETVKPDEDPAAYVLRVAREKAQSALSMLEKAAPSDFILLAADTAVIDPSPTQGHPAAILGKPSGQEEAVNMLLRLRGRTHQVYTGLVALRLPDRMMLEEVVSTAVSMRSYSDQEVLAYVASGDPLDKAGAYAIQNQSFHPVQNLQGCYANVMGLPVCHVARLLAKLGSPAPTDFVKSCQQTLDFHCLIYEQVGSQ